jgi:undecaprenyl-diphosphatase
MTIIQALILSIVQGIAEFLPISSSAHLKILPWIFNWNNEGTTFDIIVHTGSFLAVLIYMNKDIISFLRNDISQLQQKFTMKTISQTTAFKLIIASIPAGVIGLLFEDQIAELTDNLVLIAIMLITLGIIFLFLDKIESHISNLKEITPVKSIFIGISQAIALIRGTSRSGITITTGKFLGLTKDLAARFSFLMSTIVMAGVTLIGVKDLLTTETSQELHIYAIGFTGSFLSSIFAIKLLFKVLKGNNFKWFGVYRILLGMGIIAWLIAKAYL